MDLTGLEPVISSMPSRRFIQLSYRPNRELCSLKFKIQSAKCKIADGFELSFVLGGIRTPNNWSEASCDIHFTTRTGIIPRICGTFRALL